MRRSSKQIQQHTVLGFQLIRQMPLENSRPAHVALQHHERQDGSGYPSKLFGNNRVYRTQSEKFDLRRINLLAELASVADVCSALSSDRPYRSALPTLEVARLLKDAAGAHLNSEAVDAFLGVVQLFPVGVTVRISGGRYDGCLGVVVAQAPKKRNRPVVRLLYDRHARHLGEGIEVKLQDEPDTVEVRSLPETGLSLVEQAQEMVGARAA